MNRNRSSIAHVSFHPIKALDGSVGIQSVTHVPGSICYPCARFVQCMARAFSESEVVCQASAMRDFRISPAVFIEDFCFFPQAVWTLLPEIGGGQDGLELLARAAV
jgi:hypothetical protein